MAYLSNLQEPMQPPTQGVIFSWSEHLSRNYEGNTRQNRSITFQGPLGLEHHGAYHFAEGDFWRAEAGFAATQVPILLDFSVIGELLKAFSIFNLAFRSSRREKKQIEGEEGTLTPKSSQSKLWEAGYSWDLTLQDLLVTKQIWEARNVLVHASSNKDWNLMTLSRDILSGKRALEENKGSTVQPLEQSYVFRRPAEVRHFLEENPFLVPLLNEAYTHIRKYFPSLKIFLEVVADPEAFDEEQLVIFIAVDRDPDGASEALDQLDQNWWLDALERSQDKLCITLEFQ